MGEFEFIEDLRARFGGIGDPLIEGIGDDCAVIPIGEAGEAGEAGGAKEKEAFVVTTDMLVEGVHFLRSATTAKELGGKSLAVSLSDVAAMGARPVASFLSVALPADCRGDWSVEFAVGYAEMSERYGVKPAGGDTTSSLGGVAISVTVVGRAPVSHLKRRSAAKVGDVVAVAGMLGASAAGLAEILSGVQGASLSRQIHNNPTPQVFEGAWLGAQKSVHAMMDLSDGLASDLVHILRASGVGEKGVGASGVGAEIELTKIPTEAAVGQAVAGGEDYVLLLTAAADDFARLEKDFRARFGTPLYNIGMITAAPPHIEWLENGVPVDRDWKGFTHF